MPKDISSPFVVKKDVPVIDSFDKEFVHFMEVESVAEGYDPSKPSEFLIETSVEEYERIPICDYINSFASKVGLKNELKGIISKSQMDDYISSHKAQPGFTDLTILPDTEFELSQFAGRIEQIWDSIPSDLKGNLTKEEFLKTLTSEKIKSYIMSQIPKDSGEKGE